MPDRLINKLKYVEQFSSVFAGGVLNQVYSANGLFDPNITGVGHQPLSYDQMTPLYERYTVLNSSCKVTMMTGTAAVGTLTVSLNDDPSTFSQISMREGPKSQNKVWSASNMAVVMTYFNAEQFFGDNVENNTLYQGSSVSNPSEQAYYSIRVDESSLGSSTVNFLVEIEYTVLWSEMRLQSAS